MKEEIKENKDHNGLSHTEIEKLKAEVTKLDTSVTTNSKLMEAEIADNTTLKAEKLKKLQVESALKAKELFIEENYDYCKHPKELKAEVFQKISSENTGITSTMQAFIQMLTGAQKDILDIERARENKKSLAQK